MNSTLTTLFILLLLNTSALGSEWVGGTCDRGKGIYLWDNGEKYQGECRDGRFNGWGVISWADGRRYEGGFKNGDKHGEGTYYFPDGSHYVLEYRNGNLSASTGILIEFAIKELELNNKVLGEKHPDTVNESGLSLWYETD